MSFTDLFGHLKFWKCNRDVGEWLFSNYAFFWAGTATINALFTRIIMAVLDIIKTVRNIGTFLDFNGFCSVGLTIILIKT